MNRYVLPTLSRLMTIAVVMIITGLMAMAPARGQLLEANMADFISLRHEPRVDGPFVTVGDVFDVNDERAALRITKSPKPGMRLSISSSALARFLRQNNIYWENALKLRQVFVTRNSTVVGESEIKDALQFALEEMGELDPVDIRLYNRSLAIHLPLDAAPVLRVENMTYDAGSGRIQADLLGENGTDRPTRTSVSANVIPVQLIPVLARPVSRGALLTEADFEIERIPTKRVGANIVASLADAKGMEARRALRAGQPVRTTDLKAQTLIAKGALVTMTFEMPGLRLTNVGKALQDGSQGDVINIMNQKSKQTVMAKVISHNQVSVKLGGDVQLAALD